MTATADPSRRHALPDDHPYLANLAALWATVPDLAAEIESGDELYPVEPSKAGPLTTTLPTPDGRAIYLHSRYNPLDEAKKLSGTVKATSVYVFAVHGLALGYHVEALFDAVSDESIVCVIEPDVKLIRTTFHHRDLSKLIVSNRVLFFTRADKADLFVRLGPQMALVTVGLDSLVHPPSLQVQPEFHAQFQTWLAEFCAYAKTNIQTLILNGRRTAENIARNLAWYVSAPGLARLKDRHKGQPAIIVSAGPSLRKNKHLLHDAQGKAVIVAVQTTLKPLLEMGIEPHFVTSLDYHDICTRFFENLPQVVEPARGSESDGATVARSPRTELVAEPKASDKIFALHPGPLSLLGNDYAEGLLREMRVDKTRLTAGATVAHLAYYLAEHLGCNPIIFVGQDLGFSDGLCYTPGTSYENVWAPELSRFCTLEMKQWDQVVRDRPILRRIPDVDGRPMYTEERLFTYLQQFERDFSRTATTIIDATEGGAFKRGSMPMKLADALARFCTSPVEPPAADHPGQAWDRVAPARASIEARRDEADDIERISRETLPLLQEVHDHLDDQSRVNRAIARIDSLRNQMNGLGATYDLITQLTQTSELRRFEQDRAIAASRAKGTDRQRRQVARDIDNVKSLIEAIAPFRALMNDVLGRLGAASGSAEQGGQPTRAPEEVAA
jgi:hypothetical protein